MHSCNILEMQDTLLTQKNDLKKKNRDWIQQESKQGSVLSTDSGMISPQESVYGIRKLCLLEWRERLFMPLQKELLDQVFGLIELDRLNSLNMQYSRLGILLHDAQQLPSNAYTLLKPFLDSLITLGVDNEKQPFALYETLFERPFLEMSTSLFYRQWCKNMLITKQFPIEVYVDVMQQQLDFESKRVLHYLNPTTKQKLLICVVKEVVEKQLSHLLDHTLCYWVANNCIDQLSRMYRFVSNSPNFGIQEMLQRFQDYITEEGIQELQKCLDMATESEHIPQLFVEAIIRIYIKHTHIVECGFNEDKLFLQARDIGCKRFINHGYSEQDHEAVKSAEYLAKVRIFVSLTIWEMMCSKSPTHSAHYHSTVI